MRPNQRYLLHEAIILLSKERDACSDGIALRSGLFNLQTQEGTLASVATGLFFVVFNDSHGLVRSSLLRNGADPRDIGAWLR